MMLIGFENEREKKGKGYGKEGIERKKSA